MNVPIATLFHRLVIKIQSLQPNVNMVDLPEEWLQDYKI